MASPTRAFAYFEWMIAARYLRAKRREGYVSVISIISLVGVALGVATLIIVMSVMNGFRHDLMSRMLGVNGHATVQSLSGPLTDYDAVAARVRAVPGVVRAAPTVDGQVLGTSSGLAQFVLVRGMSLHDLETLSTVRNRCRKVRWNIFTAAIPSSSARGSRRSSVSSPACRSRSWRREGMSRRSASRRG